jgi:diacylglycerol kinase
MNLQNLESCLKKAAFFFIHIAKCYFYMMENRKQMNFGSRSNSFKYALSGLVQLFKQEPNARIHFAVTVAVLIAGIFKHISPIQWIAILIVIALVWICEAFNTAIEMLCDLYSDGKFHPTVKIIKDISAGAVLIASILSMVAGVIVFLF